MRPEQRRELVRRIAQAMASGKDSGGYDTLLEMYAHTALKVIETEAGEEMEPKEIVKKLNKLFK